MLKLHLYRKYTSYFYLYLITTGTILILFGILFLIMPELLIYLVSFFFILFGVASIALALRVKRMERRLRKKINNLSSTVKEGWDDIRDIWDAW